MSYGPTDVVVRVSLNPASASTAAEAMQATLDLVAELKPAAVEFESADPDGLRTGFLAGLLLVCPRAEGADPERSLRASVGPLISRLGFDEARFSVDDTGLSGWVDVPDRLWQQGRTVCGAYALYARVGADPFEEPDDEDDEGGEEGEDYLDLTPSVPHSPLSEEDIADLMNEGADLASVYVGVEARLGGLGQPEGRRRVAALAEHVREACPGTGVTVELLDQLPDSDGMPVLGALIGPTGLDPDDLDDALVRVHASLPEYDRGAASTDEDGPGSCRVTTWLSPTAPLGSGSVQLRLTVATKATLIQLTHENRT